MISLPIPFSFDTKTRTWRWNLDVLNLGPELIVNKDVFLLCDRVKRL